MSVIVVIADTLTAELNGSGLLPEGVVAVRAYRPSFDLKEMEKLHVTVVPKGVEMTTAARGLAQNDVQIDIGVQQKLSIPANEAAEIDALMELVEKIADFVRETRQFGNAVWVKTENNPIYAPEHLSELRQFTSVLTLTFRVMTT